MTWLRLGSHTPPKAHSSMMWPGDRASWHFRAPWDIKPRLIHIQIHAPHSLINHTGSLCLHLPSLCYLSQLFIFHPVSSLTLQKCSRDVIGYDNTSLHAENTPSPKISQLSSLAALLSSHCPSKMMMELRASLQEEGEERKISFAFVSFPSNPSPCTGLLLKFLS